MKSLIKKIVRTCFPWLLRFNRPAGGQMGRMIPGRHPGERELVFFENGSPFLLQNCHQEVMKARGGSRCGLWDGRLFFSRSDYRRPRAFWPFVQHAPLEAVKNSPPLAAFCAEYQPQTVRQFVARRIESAAASAIPKFTACDEDSFVPHLPELIEKANSEPVTKSATPHFLVVTYGLDSGGAERQWCYLARELASRGCRVSFLVDHLREEYGHYLPLLAGSPVDIHTLDSISIAADTDLSVPANFPYNLAKYVLPLRHLRPTHVLCQLDTPNLWAGAAALLSACGAEKVLLSFRNANPSHFSYIYKPWMLPWYRAMLRSPKIVLSGNSRAGNDDYAEWLGIPKDQVAYIPNAMQIESIHSQYSKTDARRRLDIPADAPVIIGAFRLSPEKNPDLFLSVIKNLHEKRPDLITLHAGEGAEAERLHAKAEIMGLGQALRFLGRRNDVPDIMRAADLLLLCSDHEGLPNILLEAQVMELPVVATDAGGACDAVREEETALIAQTGDAETLTSHCETLLNNPQKRESMGRAGRAFVLGHFTPKALADNTLAALGILR